MAMLLAQTVICYQGGSRVREGACASSFPHRNRGPGFRHNEGPRGCEGRCEEALRGNIRRGQSQTHDENVQGVAECLRGVRGGAGGETAPQRTPQGGMGVP